MHYGPTAAIEVLTDLPPTPSLRPARPTPSLRRGQSAHCSLLTVPYALLITHWRALLTAHHSLLTVPYSLLRTHCSSLTGVHCSLLTTHCSLFLTHCSVRTAQHSLACIAHCSPLTVPYSLLITHWRAHQSLACIAHCSVRTAQHLLAFTAHCAPLTAHHSLTTTGGGACGRRVLRQGQPAAHALRSTAAQGAAAPVDVCPPCLGRADLPAHRTCLGRRAARPGPTLLLHWAQQWSGPSRSGARATCRAWRSAQRTLAPPQVAAGATQYYLTTQELPEL